VGQQGKFKKQLFLVFEKDSLSKLLLISMPLIGLRNSPRVHLPFLLTILCLVNGFLLYSNGIKVVDDSERYFEYANVLRSGFYFDPHNFWYIGYCLFILIVSLFGGGSTSIVVIQILLFCFATFSLYYTALLIWKSPGTAFVTAFLFVAFIDIPQWNSYVLAESLFVSFNCFSLLALTLLFKDTRKVWKIGLVLLIIPITFLIKPTGIALLVACASVLTLHFFQSIKNNLGRLAIGAGLFGLVILLTNRMLHTYLVMENYQLGEVIYAVTTVDKVQYSINGLIVTPPENLYVPQRTWPPIVKIISFAVQHPVYWTQLFFTKAFYLLFHVRPFWSFSHNMFSVLFLLPSYFLCIVAFIRARPGGKVTVFGVTFLLINIFAVCLTSEDWDGRFLIPMLPVVFLFASRGLEILFKKWLSASRADRR
jgi:hypothetical protein